LLLAGADVDALSKAVELALFYDAKLDVAAMDKVHQVLRYELQSNTIMRA
jgi:hypothetical protein